MCCIAHFMGHQRQRALCRELVTLAVMIRFFLRQCYSLLQMGFSVFMIMLVAAICTHAVCVYEGWWLRKE